MSMNLHLKVDGERTNTLWQTPTTITYMCMVQHDGTVPFELKGKKARRALNCYKQWVKGSNDGVWNDREEHKKAILHVKGHLTELAHLTDGKKIVVSIM